MLQLLEYNLDIPFHEKKISSTFFLSHSMRDASIIFKKLLPYYHFVTFTYYDK